MGQTELLEVILEDERALAKAGEVRSELERLEQLTHKLLQFVNSRRVEKTACAVAALLEQIQKLARSQKLVIEHAELPERWDYDEVTLLRAVDNVVSNACSFGEHVVLKVEASAAALTMTVSDDGPGFAQGVDVFAPFVTTRLQGTGLGLSIAAEIVRAHGGVITAQNRPGGGAQVCIRLPR